MKEKWLLAVWVRYQPAAKAATTQLLHTQERPLLGARTPGGGAGVVAGSVMGSRAEGVWRGRLVSKNSALIGFGSPISKLQLRLPNQ